MDLRGHRSRGMAPLAVGLTLVVAACGSVPAPSSPSGALATGSPVASGSVAPQGARSATPRTSSPPGTLTRFDGQSLTEGNQLLTLQFVGGRFYSPMDPCSRAYAGWAEPVGDVLEAAVVDVTPPQPVGNGGTPAACDAVGHFRTVTVSLPTPFVGSRIHDRAGYTHFVLAPDGLVTLRALPASWLLRSERDVEDSPTGRWQRTYSPLANPDVATSKGKIDLFQAFGGPAGVSGGDEQRTVTVNGRSATLYRSAPDGELVLVWDLGSDGLALAANESDFPADKLILLAESATPG